MSTPTYAALGLGGAGFVFALFALANGGTSEGEVSRIVDRETREAVAQVEGLETRIAELEGALAAATAEASSAEGLAAIEEQVAALSESSDEAQTAIAALTEQGSAMSQELSALAERVAGAETAAAGATEAAMAAAAAPTAAPQAEAAADAPSMAAAGGDGGTKVGETALFADGDLRIFVSRLLANENAARLSVNGDQVTLSAGDARTVAVAGDYCRYTLDAVSADGASLSALCADALPAPEGLSPGETVILADGAVRVFASRITDESARLSANGETITLAVGRSAPVPVEDQTCRVAVDSIDRGHVAVSAACGADVAVSEMAGVGSTVVLGDGAARVFVSTVTDDGMVRFAVNGQDMVMGASGDSFAAGEGCMVTVEDVSERSANFSYACDG